jgi:TrmH family RNA methyltransferase
VRRITSRQNPLVARYRAVARGEVADTVLLDGVHLVADALAAGIPIRSAAVAIEDGVGSANEALRVLLGRLNDASVDLVDAPAQVMAALSPVQSPSAIVALAERPRHAIDEVFAGPAPLVVIAVGVQDPGNVGAIIRVAEAGGATGVLTTGASASPFGWKALRGSMGSALRLPVLDAVSPEQAVAEARRRGCRVLAMAPRGGTSVFDAAVAGPLAVLIGGEGQGLPGAWLDLADARVTIPMQAPVESLNAAVAAALIVYEARRQRAASRNREPGTTS